MSKLKWLLVLGWLGLICACGKPSVTGDPAPFQQAVVNYCQAKSYGMAISEVVALKPDGETATMTCKMKDAEGLYTLSVTWAFTLRREGDRWTVTSHVQK